MAGDFYHTIESPSQAELRERGSRFLGFAYPLPDTATFKLLLSSKKTEHPKASHYCFAYRLGVDGNIFRSSDDGEPPGTAGRPILGQIDSKQLTQVLIIVVRYFGGTLLGVPGLTSAYKSAAALSLQDADIVQKAVLVNYRLQFDYTRLNEVMTIIKFFNCPILVNETQLFCNLEIGIPRNKLTEVMHRLKELSNIEIEKAEQHDT